MVSAPRALHAAALAVSTVVAALVLSGCLRDFAGPAEPDAGAGPALDGGARADGGMPADGSLGQDGGVPADAGVAVDGGSVDGGAGDAGIFDGGGVDGGADGGAADGGAADGLCPAALTYQGSVGQTVFVAGEFNGWSPTATPLSHEGNGVYRTQLRLAPGLYGYKVVVDGNWLLDSGQPYRVYDNHIENSGLRVADCGKPALRVESATAGRPARGQGSITARLRYDARSAGALGTVRAEIRLQGGVVRALTSSELTVSGTQVDLQLSALADGKHTVRLVAVGATGRESEAVLLPMWIEAEAFDWRDTPIYLVFTDRFRDGQPQNNRSSTGATPTADWMGGDLQGVTAAINEGYFDQLGIKALWLSPFNQNPTGTYPGDEGAQVSGYHGYWPIDPLHVDARLGGDAALTEMVRAAHQKGIRVLMDWALNQVHEDHPYVSEHPEWFNTGCVCGTAGCDWTERRLDCLFKPYLPDINWENRAASEQFIRDALDWMERFDLDGFRVDAVKHVPDGAVFNLGTRVRESFERGNAKTFLMGETAMGWCANQSPTSSCNATQYGTISRYINPFGLTGQFDFVLYYAAGLKFLATPPCGDGPCGMLHVDYWTKASLEQYPAGAIMTPYIGSHDSTRFMTLAANPDKAGSRYTNLPPQPTTDEPYDRMYLAFAWLFSIPGAPLLYNGDEYGEYGGADPDNRHRTRFGSALNAREQAQLTRIRRLLTARAQLRGLRRGEYRSLEGTTETLWTIARGAGAELVIVAMNRGSGPETKTFDVSIVAQNGRVFTDALGSSTTATVTSGSLTLTLPARSVMYLK